MLSLLTGSSGVDSRKTITFGDAAAVRSQPLWSLISLLLLLVLWWGSTAIFGFPEDFRAQAEAAAEVQMATGMLESSNVNIVDSMVKMIELGRRFEMQVKMMQEIGDTEESLASVMRIG